MMTLHERCSRHYRSTTSLCDQEKYWVLLDKKTAELPSEDMVFVAGDPIDLVRATRMDTGVMEAFATGHEMTMVSVLSNMALTTQS